ncbi:MAG: putative multicopper oxidase [Piptocephalis tieghemiana]|nr:MAG: putative multicopper oxidase [Piptocephalis tieghemiana]
MAVMTLPWTSVLALSLALSLLGTSWATQVNDTTTHSITTASTTTTSPVSCDPATCTLRNYYISAQEMIWDYAPSGMDLFRNVSLEESEQASIFAASGRGRIGRSYFKALYRGYTGPDFTQPTEREPWLGFLGPIIRAEVGDVIRVHFFNNATFPYSIHPHGVLYTPANEGAYHAGSGPGASVPPYGNFTYTWRVPERSGPGPADPSSLMWLYHSHHHEPQDVNAGLVGPMIIYRRGALSGPLRDYDDERIAFFMVHDENKSHYLKQNLAIFAGDITMTGQEPKEVLAEGQRQLEDPGFVESNMMHGINGRIFNNLPGLTGKVNHRLRWYIGALGNEVDLHTAHWHGSTGLSYGRRLDVLGLLPGATRVVDMTPDVPGTWLFHCHVDDHMSAGMTVNYTITA